MANEFWYSVSLSILHPDWDLSEITREISILKPRRVSKSGDLSVGPDGLPRIPERKVEVSNWSADLHSEPKLYSGEIAFNDFLKTQVDLLQPYRSLFLRCRDGGHAAFFVGWFMDSTCAADWLDAEMIQQCGDLGLDIELHVYANQQFLVQ